MTSTAKAKDDTDGREPEIRTVHRADDYYHGDPIHPQAETARPEHDVAGPLPVRPPRRA